MIEELKSARLKAGMTQKEVAEALGITQPVVAGWERGKGSPSVSRLIQLANLYNTSVDKLVGRK
ncbi:MAG: helix-turn-helix transcriptional regulator [Prevotellaceae bacterium]|nr:helix-turn-helix transcriptional regulator [Prevotellaceae bacterium]